MDILKVDAFKYNLLNSLYSFPNIIIPLFGGKSHWSKKKEFL
jgi:hypothetical protein